MAESVVNFVVETIGKMVIEEAKFLYGVENQVQQLKLELDRMLSFLRDAEARQDEQGNLKVWISQTRDLAYEAVDLLESYAFKIASQKENIFKRSVCILNECYDRHSIGSEIQSLQSKIAGLTTSFQRYGIRITEREDLPSSSQQQLRRTYSHVAVDDFIDVDNDVEMLAGHLVNQNEAVVSIYGMGGLGKTTIAREVYNRPEVQGHFKKQTAWVCISQQWQMREILLEVLIKFFPLQRDEIVKSRDAELIRKLSQTMQNRKCLVVLDDIWSTDVWECIKEAFPTAKEGSKLLLTTRNKGVALHVDPHGFHHEPRLLYNNESWDLLQRKALRGRTYMRPEEMQEMEALGNEMVKHCGGLPLAVVVLGGILKQRDINGWKTIHENVGAHIKRGENTVEEESKVQEILDLSYKDLPPKLKPCFLYLGRFPEDSNIDVDKLCQLWIAEGMILIRDQIGEESMMDVAERYLGNLVERSMVQVKVDEDFHKGKSCRLHDLIRDLTLEKAKEENFFLLVHSRNGFDDQVYESSSSTHQIHRLVIHFQKEDVHKYVPPQKRTTRHLRSLRLLVEKGEYEDCMVQTIMSQLSWFKMLRVLEIEVGNRQLKLPKVVGNLIHLRYLSVGASNLLRLPSSIGNLKHLQTLDLENVSFCNLIPDVLYKMRQLKYLLLPLIYFQTFSLKGLNKLKILKKFNGPIRNFSNNEACSFASSLISLSLSQSQSQSQLADDPMETLEKLPNLRSLRLGYKSFMGTEMQCGASGFRRLRRLELFYLPNLAKWTIVEGSMPNLSSLKIESCRKLEMIPDGLRHITALKSLKIAGMPTEFASRVQQRGEDFNKIRHVPFIKVKPWFSFDDVED